ncbi:hypothetical protein GCM10022254_17790 [Actinomadura meridiana]|uniref:Anti-sigma factor antagonist n=2 Tax=Actinomadura meridiana TaxID=559626 RepID=A0ABP8BXA3_9ACTN
MVTPHSRGSLGEGAAGAREARPAAGGFAGTPRGEALAIHSGSALTFQTTDVIGGELLVMLAGEIDASNSGWLSGRLTAVVTGRAVASGVVVDLSKVGFCDASGISVLVNALKRCRSHQIALELAGAHGRVARVLRLTGVDQALPLYTDLAGALQAIARHRSAPVQVPPRQSMTRRKSESGGGDGGGGADAVAQQW